MHQNQIVQARVNGEIKAQAAANLAAVGLSVSDAVRMLLTRIAQDNTLPLELFRPIVPNAATLEAMREVEEKFDTLPRVKSVKELFKALNSDD